MKEHGDAESGEDGRRSASVRQGAGSYQHVLLLATSLCGVSWAFSAVCQQGEAFLSRILCL